MPKLGDEFVAIVRELAESDSVDLQRIKNFARQLNVLEIAGLQVTGMMGGPGQVQHLEAGPIVIDGGGFGLASRQVTIDDDGIQLAPGSAAANQVQWLSQIGGTQIASILTTVVGSSPDRYGLLMIRAEPETGSTNASSQGLVEIRAYDHDGSADDVLRGTIQLTGGAASIALNDTSEVVTNRLSMSQTTTTFNSNNANVDTVIAGDTVADVFKVDAGEDKVIIGGPKSDTGDPTGQEGMIYINTFDNAVRMYADGSWRELGDLVGYGSEFRYSLTANCTSRTLTAPSQLMSIRAQRGKRLAAANAIAKSTIATLILVMFISTVAYAL